MRDGFTKLGTVGAVPGINFIERFERWACCVGDADEVESCVGDGTGFIGEADQRQSDAGRPDFGVIGSRGFESGEREDDVADGAGADQKAFHLCTAGDGDFNSVEVDRSRRSRLQRRRICNRRTLFSFWFTHFEHLRFLTGFAKRPLLADLLIFRIA